MPFAEDNSFRHLRQAAHRRGTRYGALTLLAACALILLPERAQAQGTFTRHLTITVGGAVVGGGAKTNFPMLVDVTDTDLRCATLGPSCGNPVGSVQSTNGYDIVFRGETAAICAPSASPCMLDHEIELYDGVAGRVVAWVRVPSLDNNRVIHMYYGNSQITAPTAKARAVWDDDYLGVWHLGGTSTGARDEFADSGRYGNHGRGGDGSPLNGIGVNVGLDKFVPSQLDGKIGKAQDFASGAQATPATPPTDGYYDLIDAGSDITLDPTGSQITIQAWVRHNTSPAFGIWPGILCHKSWYGGYGLGLEENTNRVRFILTGESGDTVTSALALSATVWHQVVATYDGATMRIYLDGAADANTRAKTSELMAAPFEGGMWIGQGDQPKDKAWSNPYAWMGQLDEVRISRTARSADWITTEYNNQSTPGSFYAVTVLGAVSVPLPTLTINYRSIGVNPAVLYGTGTASVAFGGTTVTFSGSLPPNVGAGDRLVLEPGTGSEETLFLLSRDSTTQATVQTAAAGAHAGAFEIRRAYTSLQAWEDDRDGNLVAEDRREIGLVYNDGPLTGTLTIDGSTTDPHRFLQLQAAPGHLHSGVAGTGVILDPTVNGHAVEVLDDHTRVDWLEIRGWQGAGSSGVRVGAHNTSFHGLLVHDSDPTATDADGFSMDTAGDWLASVRNSIVYNVRRAGFQIQNPAGSRQPVFRLDNVTVYNCGGATTTPSLAGGVSLCEGPTSRARAQVRGLLSVGNIDADLDGDADFNLGGFADGCYLRNTGTATVAPASTTVTFSVAVPNDIRQGDRLVIDPGGGNQEVFTVASRNPAGTQVTVAVAAVNNHAGEAFRIERGSALYAWWAASAAGTLARGQSSHNMSSNGAVAPGINPQAAPVLLEDLFVSAGVTPNLHLETAGHNALDTAVDLASLICCDIDRAPRPFGAAWDIGADEAGATTAVKMQSLSASPGDGSIEVEWRTASELDNLGFHVYRGPSEGGPWTRLTASLIPGLGSSAVGQAYSFRDSGLVNGTTYYYRLEDVDASSKTTSHGPVSAVPLAGAAGGAPGSEPPSSGASPKDKGASSPSCPDWVLSAYASATGANGSTAALVCARHGDPEAVSFDVVARDSRSATLELRTGGFYSLREASGGIRVFVPGFDFPSDPQAAALPFRRALVEAIVGRRVELGGARAMDQVAFADLVPGALGKAEMQVSWDGTVRAGRRGVRAPASRGAATDLVRLLPSAFQGETKSAVVEISPLRFDPRRKQLLLAKRVRLRLLFTGRETAEGGRGHLGRKQAPQKRASGELLARLYTTSRGLYAVSFDQLFPGRRRGLLASELRLERQGEAQAFHLEPASGSFGPGGVLYFHADTEAASTDFSSETAFELVLSREGLRMPLASAAPSGEVVASASTRSARFETNRFYQPGLLDAEDPWQWEGLASGTTRAMSFTLSGVSGSAAQAAELEVFLQGASESGRAVDHHVSVSVNGTLAGEAWFAGKQPYRMTLSVPAALLREGANELQLTNGADTGVTSYVFLDRFTLSYPQASSLTGGVFEGTWAQSGTATVSGTAAALLDVTAGSAGARWLTGYEALGGVLRFRSEAGHRYLAVSPQGLLTPRVAAAAASSLRATANQADYLLIAPSSFLAAAEPLLERRRDQGLQARAVSFEEIADVFGHGQPSAEAIRSFLGFAFHSWERPSPRYVLLLGDSSYDPRNFSGSARPAPLPALWTKTSYLWTASDPLLAAVNGEDALPDLAIGRLPAATVAEAERLVAKLLAWEDSGQGLAGAAALVADNPDLGGDFEADVRDIAASFLSERNPRLLLLSELGAGARPAIQDALNSGLGLLSYVGHGGAAVWASENVWNSWDAPSLMAQSRQPLLLTLNCLNGYFVAPAFDSLTESLLKAEGRGAIAGFSPSGLSLDGPAHQYHRALMAQITGGRHERLGDALTAAQRAYAQTGLMPELISVYHLLGDPAMKVRP